MLTRANASMTFRATLSLIVIIGYGTIVFRFIAGDVAYTNAVREPVMFLLGTMTASVGGIVGYWFGSSQGSADKTAAATRKEP